jgi:RNA polymerase sigma-70 factor (ECF subfamily)
MVWVPEFSEGRLSQTTQFNRIYERHHRPVLAYCLRRTTEQEAYDATSEVFSVAWRRLGDIPSGEKELAWLYGVARKVLSRQWRSAGRFRKLVNKVGSQPARTAPDVATVVVRRAEYDQVLDAATTLRQPDQEILRLAAWEGLPHSDIAQILDISVSAVDQRLHRAKKRLAAAFESAAADTKTTATQGDTA